MNNCWTHYKKGGSADLLRLPQNIDDPSLDHHNMPPYLFKNAHRKISSTKSIEWSKVNKSSEDHVAIICWRGCKVNMWMSGWSNIDLKIRCLIIKMDTCVLLTFSNWKSTSSSSMLNRDRLDLFKLRGDSNKWQVQSEIGLWLRQSINAEHLVWAVSPLRWQFVAINGHLKRTRRFQCLEFE